MIAMLTGCAAHSQRASNPAPGIHEYEEATASALAVDPPIAQNVPPLQLGRAERQPTAFVGYDEGVHSLFYLRTDDDQYFFLPNADFTWSTYERHAVSEKVGVSYR